MKFTSIASSEKRVKTLRLTASDHGWSGGRVTADNQVVFQKGDYCIQVDLAHGHTLVITESSGQVRSFASAHWHTLTRLFENPEVTKEVAEFAGPVFHITKNA